MSTAIAPTESNAVAIAMPDIAALQQGSAYANQTGFIEVAGPGFGSFLPYMQLFTSNSDEVKTGMIPVAHYGLVEGKEKKLTPLGNRVLCSPVAWRAKAMFFKTADGKPLAYHNPKSEEFKSIRDKANEDSNSGNMYGVEFLVWLPETKKLATFFMGTKTARNAAGPVHALLPRSGGSLKLGVLTAQLIDNGDYKWHGPVMNLSDQSFDNPNGEELTKAIVDFLNPRDSVPEEAAPKEATNVDR